MDIGLVRAQEPEDLRPSGTERKTLSEEQLNRRVEDILSHLSEEEKIGQLMLIGIKSTRLKASDLAFIRDKHFGGVILFDWNMKKPVQVKRLNTSIQQQGTLVVRGDQEYRLPLFIAVDMEGGSVFRMQEKWPGEPIPAAKVISGTGKVELAKKWAVKVARILKEMGFNVNFAPVADLNDKNSRSYSEDCSTATEYVRAALEGYQSEGIIACLKHFPGIGRAVVDPHLDGSVIKEDLEILAGTDLKPFQTMIEERDNNTFMVMISHLSYPALDKERPASLSPRLMQDLLKDKVGFTGLAITDDLEMGAIAKHYRFEEIGVMAINAGADLALVCHEPENIEAIYQGLLKAYKEGRLSKDRVDDCLRRILRAKIVNLGV